MRRRKTAKGHDYRCSTAQSQRREKFTPEILLPKTANTLSLMLLLATVAWTWELGPNANSPVFDGSPIVASSWSRTTNVRLSSGNYLQESSRHSHQHRRHGTCFRRRKQRREAGHSGGGEHWFRHHHCDPSRKWGWYLSAGNANDVSAEHKRLSPFSERV